VVKKDLIIPYYAKLTILIVGIIALLTVLYIAQSIIIPLVFAIVISIVLHPIVKLFVRIKINRLIAIIITMLLTFIVIAVFGILLVSQARHFGESWPALIDKLTLLLNQSISKISIHFDINPKKIHEWISNAKTELINMNTTSAIIGKTLLNVGSWIVILLLVPVYIFMILFYEPLLLDFIRKLFGTNHQSKVSEIVTQTKTVIQRYLIGLLIEATIIAILYTVTLLFLGVDYAILLGIIGALINVIPYIGGIVGVALPMIVALATKSTAWYAIYILIIFYIIQLIDNNFIVPKIVASKVKINALFSIIVVIVGNALWGIPGMFLSIPLLAIVKLIFDHIEPLKPWGFLLGDTMPPILTIKPILKKFKKNAS
jgi:predicted PurR-regulated permease PerM